MKKLKHLLQVSICVLLALVIVFNVVACSASQIKPGIESEGASSAETAPGDTTGDLPTVSPTPPITEVIGVTVNLAQKQPFVGKEKEKSQVIPAEKLCGFKSEVSADSKDGLTSYISDQVSVVYDTNADAFGVVDTLSVNDVILIEKDYFSTPDDELSLNTVYAEYYEVEVDYTEDGKIEGLYYYDSYYIYHYNAQGQLTDIYRNGEPYKTFSYNAYGKITKEVSATKQNSFERVFSYTEAGALYSVNDQKLAAPIQEGQTIRVGSKTYSQSDSVIVSVQGDTIAEFEYGYEFNGEKFLTSKRTNDSVTEYKYVGDKVVEISGNGKTVSYILDKDLNYVGLSFAGAKYYFAVDPFGNVMGLLNCDGSWVVEYQYDAWGNILGVTGDLAHSLGVANEILNLNGIYDHTMNCYFFGSDLYLPEAGITLHDQTTDHVKSIYDWEQSNYFARSAVSSFARIHDMVVDVAVQNLKEQGMDVISHLYAVDKNGDSKRLVDIYTLDYSVTPFSAMNLLNGNQIYEVIYHNPDSENFEKLATDKLNYIYEQCAVSYFGDYSKEKSDLTVSALGVGTMKFHGQFVFLGYLIDYRCAGNGVIEYQVKKNIWQNYDQTINIYDYDQEKYICFVNNTFDLNFLDGVTIIPGISGETYEKLDGYLTESVIGLQTVSGNVCDQMLIYNDPSYYKALEANQTKDYWAQMNLESPQSYLEIQADGTFTVKTMPAWETDGFATKMLIGTGVIVVTAVVATIAISIPGANCVVVSICVGMAKGAVGGALSGFAFGAVAGAGGELINQLAAGNTVDWRKIADAAAMSAADGYMSGAITGAIMGGISGGLNPKYCFKAGTPISTENGAVAIENIAVGDMVWSYDYMTGEKSLKPVTATTVRETDQILTLEIGGEAIVTTPEHPFYVVNDDKYDGYVAAKYLDVGDCIMTTDGGYVTITSIEQETLDEPIAVYNFTVNDNHSYYVGDNEALVHNVSCKDIKADLPNQGVISEIDNAPKVDAGKQGKHVVGHPNDTNPMKTKWKPGENGVRQTQEAWLNSTPTSNPNVRIGTASDGRTIKIHIDSKGNIHGYPIK